MSDLPTLLLGVKYGTTPQADTQSAWPAMLALAGVLIVAAALVKVAIAIRDSDSLSDGVQVATMGLLGVLALGIGPVATAVALAAVSEAVDTTWWWAATGIGAALAMGAIALWAVETFGVFSSRYRLNKLGRATLIWSVIPTAVVFIIALAAWIFGMVAGALILGLLIFVFTDD